ncbi:MAG: hypothetical protein DRZ90_06520 [Spirochaetes bacterium]|nr:MAG: hypothetical protein DRZ90_06520 [Spirochaetota bacterium]
MSIVSTCTACGTQKTFSDDKKGKRYICPECKEIVHVPDNSVQSEIGLNEQLIGENRSDSIQFPKSDTIMVSSKSRNRTIPVIVAASLILVLMVFLLKLGVFDNQGIRKRNEQPTPPEIVVAESPMVPTEFQYDFGHIEEYDNRISVHYKDGQITAIKDDIKSSSVLMEAGSSPDTYISLRAFDNEIYTSWVEGKDSFGKDEFLEIEFINSIPIESIGIINGYTDKNLYYMNNRAETLEVSIFDGIGNIFKAKLILEDNRNGVYQIFSINKSCKKIRFTIKSAYLGTAYDDTCISEIHFQ